MTLVADSNPEQKDEILKIVGTMVDREDFPIDHEDWDNPKHKDEYNKLYQLIQLIRGQAILKTGF